MLSSRVDFRVLSDSGKRKRCLALSGALEDLEICKTMDSKGGADVEGSPSMSSGPLGSAASVGGRRRKTRRGRKGGNMY